MAVGWRQYYEWAEELTAVAYMSTVAFYELRSESGGFIVDPAGGWDTWEEHFTEPDAWNPTLAPSIWLFYRDVSQLPDDPAEIGWLIPNGRTWIDFACTTMRWTGGYQDWHTGVPEIPPRARVATRDWELVRDQLALGDMHVGRLLARWNALGRV